MHETIWETITHRHTEPLEKVRNTHHKRSPVPGTCTGRR